MQVAFKARRLGEFAWNRGLFPASGKRWQIVNRGPVRPPRKRPALVAWGSRGLCPWGREPREASPQLAAPPPGGCIDFPG